MNINKYNTFLRMMIRFDKIESITDVGSGIGNMWEYFNSDQITTWSGICSKLGVKTVNLVEKDNDSILDLVKISTNYSNPNKTSYKVIEGDYLAITTPQVDISIASGIINYYSFQDTIKVIELLNKSSKKGFIFDCYLQSPDIPPEEGKLFKSIDSLYQLFYEILSPSKIEIEIIDKNLSIWRINKD